LAAEEMNLAWNSCNAQYCTGSTYNVDFTVAIKKINLGIG